MGPEHWQRALAIFHAAVGRKGPAREAFVTQAASGDAELALEVQSLLRAHDRTGALPTSPGGAAPESGLRDIERRLARAIGDRYELGRPIGAGGMAHVLLARDRRHHRTVALKVMRPGVTALTGADRFLAEIRVTAGLHHPNILPLYDSGSVAGGGGVEDALLYYVMPYVEGESLYQLMRREEQLPVDRVLALARPVAAALDYAHAQGVVHRDIKPGNVLLRGDAVFVADFGIALALEAAGGERLTRSGMAMGTPDYMSPEQIDGAAVDGRADVYALGCLVYEMLAGEPPFSGRTPRAILMRHLADPVPPVSTLRQSLTAGADGVLETALAKAPADRYATAGAFVAALDAALAADPPARTPGRGTGRTRGRARRLEQQIRFCTARDGVRIAYASVGSGPPLVKASNWLSHLEFDAESPMWNHWWDALAAKYRFIRYDERANGLSDRDVADVSYEAWVSDLEAVVDAAGLDRFILLGISKGGAIAVAYAARHPERVSHLILHGAYTRGRLTRDTSDRARARVQMEVDMVRLGWGQESPAFRQAFTTMFFPEAGSEETAWFNELQRVSATPEDAARMMMASHRIDVRGIAGEVRSPTLILHCTDDGRVAFEEGRLLAGLIPGAEFIPLPSRNHIPLEHEPAWRQFQEAIYRFTGVE